MKKIIAAMCLSLSLLLGAGSLTAFAAFTKQLYLDIALQENVILDKYDVLVYLDEEELGTIPHGKAYTQLLDVKKGKHEIAFYDEDLSIKATAEIEVEDDCTFRCTLAAHRNEIELQETEVVEGIEGTSVMMEDVSGLSLEAAVMQLEMAGFVNINSAAMDGGKILDKSNWMVLSQNISAGEKIDKNEAILLSCQKTKDYLNDNFAEKTLQAAMETAEELNYTLRLVHKISGTSMDAEVKDMSLAELEAWQVQEAEPIASAGKDAKLLLVYTGEAEVPELVGMSLTEALAVLGEKEFSDVVYEGDTYILDKDNWEVIAQSVEAGTVLQANEQIVLGCRAYESIRDRLENLGLPL